MLTNNYRNIIAIAITSVSKRYLDQQGHSIAYDLPSADFLSVPLIDIDNVKRYCVGEFNQNFPADTFGNDGAEDRGVIYGSGNTPAQPTDYCLASPINNLTPGSITHTRGMSNGNAFLEMIIPVTNANSYEVTIREIGYRQYVQYEYPAGSGVKYSNWFLLDRTVLSTPVTIPASGTKNIRYRMEVAIPYYMD